MAGAFIKVEVDDQAILSYINELRRRGADLQPIFFEIGLYLDRATRQRWDLDVSPDGRKWAALKPSTKALKERNADKILILNGILRGTLATQATAQRLRFGSNQPYAATHQFGAKRGAFGTSRRGRPIPWGDVTARPFLGLSADDEAAILALLREYLTVAGG